MVSTPKSKTCAKLAVKTSNILLSVATLLSDNRYASWSSASHSSAISTLIMQTKNYRTGPNHLEI